MKYSVKYFGTKLFKHLKTTVNYICVVSFYRLNLANLASGKHSLKFFFEV